MEKQKITLQNVKYFLKGTIRSFLSSFNLVRKHIQEQVAYRAHICRNDCAVKGKCVKCGCSLPGKWFVGPSCNKGERFPDLMNPHDWEKYKKKNNIEIDI